MLDWELLPSPEGSDLPSTISGVSVGLVVTLASFRGCEEVKLGGIDPLVGLGPNMAMVQEYVRLISLFGQFLKAAPPALGQTKTRCGLGLALVIVRGM